MLNNHDMSKAHLYLFIYLNVLDIIYTTLHKFGVQIFTINTFILLFSKDIKLIKTLLK